MKADIQRLLQEMSGQLSTLEAQLSASRQPAPQPGTETDPSLYGAPESLPQGPGGERILPMSIGTDAAPTQSQRPAGGVGSAAGEATSASPRLSEEQASLAEHPREEPAVDRQPVPPEYREVFERLHRRDGRTLN